VATAAPARRVPVIGYPTLVPLAGVGRELLGALEEGLADFGLRVGRDIEIDVRNAGGSLPRLVELIREQAARPVSVFVLPLSNTVTMATRATASIPIVSVLIADPVELGLADSPSRPTANVTGLTVYNAPLTGKRFELLREIAPQTRRVGLLRNASYAPTETDLEQARTECARHGKTLVPLDFDTPQGLAAALEAGRVAGIDALVVVPDGVTATAAGPILAFAERHRLPGIYPHDGFTRTPPGVMPGLLSFGPDRLYNFRRAAFYVDRLLKGVPPRELPFEQPTRFRLTVSRRALQFLALSAPPSIQVRTDEIHD